MEAKRYILTTKEEVDRIVNMASKAAVEAYRSEIKKGERAIARANDKGKKVRKALQSYRRTKIMMKHEDVAIPIDEQRELRYSFLKDLMGAGTCDLVTKTESLIMDNEKNRQRNAFYIKQIEDAVSMYGKEVENAKSEEDKRRYRIMCMAFIDEIETSIREIAEIEEISEKTVYKDINIACEIMSMYMIGI